MSRSRKKVWKSLVNKHMKKNDIEGTNNIDSAQMTKIELWEELAKPDKNGVTRWVRVNEFVDRYHGLQLLNGAGWSRNDGTFGKKYIIERDKSITPGNKTDAMRTMGFNNIKSSQYINSEIKRIISSRRCVVLGTSKPEVDHKNGMKNDGRVMENENQELEDFQPLSKAANDAKRQFCIECVKTGVRYDAKQLGYPMSYYCGGAKHNGEKAACIGCFWYDPIEFRKHLIKKNK